MNRRRRLLATGLAVSLAVAGCQDKNTIAPSASSAAPPKAGYSKVLVIAEENHGYDQVIGSPDAPYLNELARTYGMAGHFDAGYPAQCPSLAAYILMTSGSTAGICDDRAPKAHPLPGDNLFHQVAASGREWRDYAESAPGPCALDNGADGRYLVRHVPATYYLDDRSECTRWSVPMGDPQAGALHDDIRAGRLPSFAFVSPDACHDMHGADLCPSDRVGKGDRWLGQWLPSILAGPDYRAGRLIVVVTWDEGTSADNHIPTLVISPTTNNVVAADAFTHCSTLRTTEEVLGLPLLGCARQAPSMVAAFHL
ncbi:alkaline phosphatase family protein [Nucisporomicrobium flavum]|uniref:alkaline phosphatase family protein n=1 Tax=Nucisporomicrobium flavum TaxID=2785915 RepID=UPI003C2E60FE